MYEPEDIERSYMSFVKGVVVGIIITVPLWILIIYLIRRCI